MGLSTTSLHIFSSEPIALKDASFVSYSEGWQTCTNDLPDNPTTFARKISKTTTATVLLFYEYDSEAIQLHFYVNGKTKAFFSDANTDLNTGIYTIPKLIGYEEGEKRRLSIILRCEDTNQKIALLEEYFGLCLTPKETLLYSPNDLNVIRGTKLYREYYETQKQYIGKLAVIKVELISEQPGKLFKNFYGFINNQGILFPRNLNYYLIGYVKEQDGQSLRPVSFQDGGFTPISLKEFLRDLVRDYREHVGFTLKYGHVNQVEFSDDAPEGFRGRSMNLPSGLYPHRFDHKNRLILSGMSSLAFVDDSLKIISKINVKGQITHIQDHYILTTTLGSFSYYGYESNARIRIYRIID